MTNQSLLLFLSYFKQTRGYHNLILNKLVIGENRNGSDKVDLDLVVLDTAPDCECEMLKNGNLECRCSQSFRYIDTFNGLMMSF